MEDDSGENEEFHSVVVPVSLIHALTFEMLYVIDQWHEDRSINDINTEVCFTAMIAAMEAAIEILHEDEQAETLQ
jgi:hypothetical protein